MHPDICRFAEYELDRNAYQLRRKGRPVQLERIPLDLLFMLAEKCGQLVTRDEILERIWGKGVFLDTDNAINTAVRKIRHALRDDSDSPRFIATVPAKGYRFVASLRDPNPARSEPASVRRHQNSLIGREREMAKLCAGLDDAASAHGRLFLISGEPGVGKTRLADEVADLAGVKRMRVLVGHCSEHDEAVAYLPFVEILENFVDRASTSDTLRTALGDQGSELARLLPKLKNLIPDLPPPLDLPPAQARRHLFNCACELVARISREQPTLIILDDLHWADDSSLSLLDHLAQRLSDLPLMVIGTFRDVELNVGRVLAKTLEDLHRARLATRVRLKGLPRDEVAAMLSSLSGKSPPTAVVAEIFAETDGNPFFVEELFRHLEEENRLYDSSGQFRSKLEIAELEAPPSVRLVVARRLARLGDLTQKMLAAAAVIGRFFSFDILQASRDADADSLLECVEEAEKAGLILSVAESPNARFEFSHELVRQAVIAGLSAARRQRLHLDVARAIERIHAGALEDHWSELAHHYRLGGDAPRAIEYLIRAAGQAAARFAHQEAISLATVAQQLLAATPNDEQRDRRELAVQRILILSYYVITGWAAPEVERATLRSLELSERINATRASIGSRMGLVLYYCQRADYERAAVFRKQLLEIVSTVPDHRLKSEIHVSIGVALTSEGELEEARRQLEQGILLSEADPFVPGSGLGQPACARAMLAQTVWRLGFPDQASKLFDQALAEARVLQHPYTNLMVTDFCAVGCMIRRDGAGAKAFANTMTEIAKRYEFTAEIISGNIATAWADAWLGDPDGVEQLREAIAAWRATGQEMTRTIECAWLGEVCLKFGRVDEAVAVLDDAVAFVARTGQGEGEADIFRLRGEAELHRSRANSASAARWFERAIDAARKRKARIAELRATVSLARLLAKQHKRDKARAMLAEIYNWFTEGFDTPDLKEAKVLLDELSA